MTTKVTIEVPESATYNVHVIHQSTGQQPDGSVITQYHEEIYKAGDKAEIYIWTGHSIQIAEHATTACESV